MSYRVAWLDLGLIEYKKAMRLQHRLSERLSEEGHGYVLFLEHPPTITLGFSLRGDEGRSAIRSTDADLKRDGVEVVEVDRGGKATYHGPGQLVCYLVLSLKEMRLGVKRYVGKMQAFMLNTLDRLGVPAYLDDSYPGVWTEGGKVAAVGVRVTERSTTHGFALNLSPDLSMFQHIVPCGISDRPVTSLKALGREIPPRDRLLAVLIEEMEKELKIQMFQGDIKKLPLDGPEA